MKELYVEKSKIHGVGLYVREGAKKDEIIGMVTGPVHVFRKFTPTISKRMVDWIGVGRYSWIETTKSMYRFINHSCEPNVVITGKRTVRALSDIKPGKEITMDYSLTEAEPGWKLENCKCGSTFCRGTVGTISTLPTNVVRKHKDHIPENFKKIYYVDNGVQI